MSLPTGFIISGEHSSRDEATASLLPGEIVVESQSSYPVEDWSGIPPAIATSTGRAGEILREIAEVYRNYPAGCPESRWVPSTLRHASEDRSADVRALAGRMLSLRTETPSPPTWLRGWVPDPTIATASPSGDTGRTWREDDEAEGGWSND